MVRHESLEQQTSCSQWDKHEEEKSGCHWTSKTGRKLPLIKTLPFLNSVLASVLNICWLAAENLSSLLWHAFEHEPVQDTEITFSPVTTATVFPPVSEDCYTSPFSTLLPQLNCSLPPTQHSLLVCSPRQPVCPSFPGLCQFQNSESTNTWQPYLFPLNLD